MQKREGDLKLFLTRLSRNIDGIASAAERGLMTVDVELSSGESVALSIVDSCLTLKEEVDDNAKGFPTQVYKRTA